jgi:osmoprotectant transport system permease protein
MEIVNYIFENHKYILTLFLQHLYIVLIALVFAFIIGIFLGIYVSREGREKFGKIVVSIMGVTESIPSIAVIALIFIYTGIGAKTAIISLAIYSVVPILFNTASALLSVPEDIKIAAKGMGMSNIDILYKVELPLSVHSIFSGVRTATTISIATATVATVIGAGGLGELILIGLRSFEPVMILVGGILVSVFAILSDLLLAYTENKIMPGNLKIRN